LTLWVWQALLCTVAIWILPNKTAHGIFGLIFYAVMVLGTILFFRKRRSLLLKVNDRPRKRKIVPMEPPPSVERPAPKDEEVVVKV